MADGIYYRDLRQPFLVADLPAITLATTQKCMWTPGITSPTILPANYWSLGKTVKLTAYLKLVTALTPGNYSFGMCYGAADAPGCIVTSTARAAVASQTFGAFIQGYAQCRSIGTAGTLSLFGMAFVDLAGMLSTAQPNVFPQGGVTVVSTIDTTVGTNGVYFTMSRSGSTVETVAVTNLLMEALN